MRIVFLHGLESTPETSSSAKLIKDNFDNVYIPDYNPKDSYEAIKNRLSSELTEEDIVIGISIGGFWTLHLTEFTDVKRIIIINPAIKKGSIYYGVIPIVPNDVLGAVILNMDDDIVDNNENYDKFNGRFSVSRFDTGGHRANNYEQWLPEVKESIDFLRYWNP